VSGKLHAPTASGEGGEEDSVDLPTAGQDFRKQKNIAPAPNRTPDRLACSLIPVMITLSM